jgi:hypothetical protein
MMKKTIWRVLAAAVRVIILHSASVRRHKFQKVVRDSPWGLGELLKGLRKCNAGLDG